MECKAHGGLGPGGSGLSGVCILRQELYNHMLHMYVKMSRFSKTLVVYSRTHTSADRVHLEVRGEDLGNWGYTCSTEHSRLTGLTT